MWLEYLLWFYFSEHLHEWVLPTMGLPTVSCWIITRSLLAIFHMVYKQDIVQWQLISVTVTVSPHSEGNKLVTWRSSAPRQRILAVKTEWWFSWGHNETMVLTLETTIRSVSSASVQNFLSCCALVHGIIPAVSEWMADISSVAWLHICTERSFDMYCMCEYSWLYQCTAENNVIVVLCITKDLWLWLFCLLNIAV